MNSRFFFSFFTSIFFLLFSAPLFANQGNFEDGEFAGQQSVVTLMKEYRFSGGLCYIQRITGIPDIVTYIATTPELANSPEQIEKCLKKLSKQKFSSMLLEQSAAVDMLKEARTANMACTQVGAIQSPVMYVVKFFNYELTGKGEELYQCLYNMGESKDKAKQNTQGAFFNNV